MIMYEKIGILTFEYKEELKMSTPLMLDFSIKVNKGRKFAVYGKNLVLVADMSTGPTLIEMNFYKLKND